MNQKRMPTLVVTPYLCDDVHNEAPQADPFAHEKADGHGRVEVGAGYFSQDVPAVANERRRDIKDLHVFCDSTAQTFELGLFPCQGWSIYDILHPTRSAPRGTNADSTFDAHVEYTQTFQTMGC